MPVDGFHVGVQNIGMETPPIKVMTLNLAHGRGTRFHQAMLRRRTIEENLDRVAEVIRRESPDMVALQEADGPSLWSGRFDHVASLSDRTELTHHYRADHVRSLRHYYGTAILSRFPLSDVCVGRFSPVVGRLRKGFVAATVNWPEGNGEVDVVSLHLDFLRTRVRRQQVALVINTLRLRQRPCIVMGDFNCHGETNDSPLHLAAHSLALHTYRPDAPDLGTFGSEFGRPGRRLDWIMLSSELAFARYHTLPDSLSDHRAVVAEVCWRTPYNGEAAS